MRSSEIRQPELVTSQSGLSYLRHLPPYPKACQELHPFYSGALSGTMSYICPDNICYAWHGGETRSALERNLFLCCKWITIYYVHCLPLSETRTLTREETNGRRRFTRFERDQTSRVALL